MNDDVPGTALPVVGRIATGKDALVVPFQADNGILIISRKGEVGALLVTSVFDVEDRHRSTRNSKPLVRHPR